MATSADVSSLDPVEVELLRHVSEGTPLDLAAGEPISKAAMASWDAGRTIHAAVIRDILCGRLGGDPDPHGLRVRGARIAGRLDLEGVSASVNLELRGMLSS